MHKEAERREEETGDPTPGFGTAASSEALPEASERGERDDADAMDCVSAQHAPGPRIPQAFAHRLSGLLARLARILPWASLALSLYSAFVMKRDEENAPLIAMVAALAFAAMLGMSLVLRAIERGMREGVFRSIARFSLTALNQNILQLCVYFALPFYFASAAFTAPQVVFLGLLLFSALIVSWDPLCERVFDRALERSMLTAFVSFSALAMVFPMLGISQGTSLYAAAFVVAILTPLARYIELDRERIPFLTIASSALFPLFLFMGLAKAVPPAPLSISAFGIGTGVEARALLGEASRFKSGTRRLYCYSAIVAPLGLKEEFEHVWSLNGVPSAPIVLTVRGGRKEGFRTWSRRQIPANFTGKLSCEVRTRGGQILGKRTVKIQ
ncbi:MAG: DUF2914 domain-containing protein [Sandaracinaceae bacterium]|nr:DUF2914 domain-containing protein [Sandaracinaceae bacterium]